MEHTSSHRRARAEPVSVSLETTLSSLKLRWPLLKAHCRTGYCQDLTVREKQSLLTEKDVRNKQGILKNGFHCGRLSSFFKVSII